MNNNIIKKTGAAVKAINLENKYRNNFIIRMSDFYPENVGEQEFCEVSREVFIELLRFKAADEGFGLDTIDPDRTATLIIRIKDFYPASEDGYVEVSREVFNFMINEKRRMESLGRSQERHEYGWDIDYEKIGEMNGVHTESSEEVFMREELLKCIYEAMAQLKPELGRRYYLNKALGYSVSMIAKMEHVTQPAVTMSIAKAEKLLRQILTEQGVM
ncbi:MAG: sigma-70 family RNA polymerase sigma factor [Ruminococcus sp.]|nr:sigma-70 family RNA polymerase sigma factor [Ruminococcus sp.]